MGLWNGGWTVENLTTFSPPSHTPPSNFPLCSLCTVSVSLFLCLSLLSAFFTAPASCGSVCGQGEEKEGYSTRSHLTRFLSAHSHTTSLLVETSLLILLLTRCCCGCCDDERKKKTAAFCCCSTPSRKQKPPHLFLLLLLPISPSPLKHA